MKHTTQTLRFMTPWSRYLHHTRRLFLVCGMWSMMVVLYAQHCPHPADTNGLADAESLTLGPDTNSDGVADYVEVNPASGQQDADGAIYDYSNGCIASVDVPIVSGATYGLLLNAGNSYTFTACSTTDEDVYPELDLWDGLAESAALLISSTTSTTGGQNCSVLTYSNTMSCTTSEVYLKVSTQNHGIGCQDDWAAWTLTTTCTTCELTAGGLVSIGADSNPATTCNAGAFTIALPTLSADCDLTTLQFDANGVLPAGTTFTYNGTTYNTAADFTVNLGLSPNVITVQAGLPVGSYLTTWSARNCVGDRITALQRIFVEPVMACNANLNVTMPSSCQVEITPDMILQAPCTGSGSYLVTVAGTNTNIITTPGTYDIEVEYIENGISTGLLCWGRVEVEDKLGPVCQSSLPDLYYPCNVSLDGVYGTPTFQDCSGSFTTSFIDKQTDGCGTGIEGDLDTDDVGDFPAPSSSLFTYNATTGMYEGNTGTIYEGFVIDMVQYREWTATDANGMIGQACTQLVYTFRPLPSKIEIPETITLECGLGLDNADPDNLSAGQVPYFTFDTDEDGTLDSIALRSVCKMAATYVDSSPIDLDCDGEYKIVRRWSVYDWCALDAGLVGEVLSDEIQVVMFQDVNAPDYDVNDVCANIDLDNDPLTSGLTSTEPDTINMDIDNCFATIPFDFPVAASISCGEYVYSLEIFETDTDNYVVGSSNPFSQILQEGDYYVNFYVENECNQLRDTCTRYFTVIDQQAPDLVCTSVTDVAISNQPDGATEVCGVHIANNSTDNCTAVTYKIRLANTSDAFTECITLNCSDANAPVMVEVVACDAAGNTTNPCMVSVTLADENGVCSCENTAPDGFVINPINDFALNETAGGVDNTQRTLTPNGATPLFNTIPSGYSVAISETTSGFGSSIVYDCDDVSPKDVFDQVVYAEITNTTNGQVSVCYDTLGIRDGSAPALNCSNFYTMALDFDNPTTYVVDAQSIIDDSPLVSSWASELSDNCTDLNDLLSNIEFSYTNANGIVETGSSLSIPIDPTGGTFQLTIAITDESDNTVTCGPVNLTTCVGGCFIVVEGRVASEISGNLQDVGIEVQGGNMDMIMTDENGAFAFEADMGNDYTIKLSKHDSYSNGVSTYDLVLLSQHILGVQSLSSPYKMIAGDANNDGYLSTFDIVMLRQLILYQITELPDVPAWRFVDGHYAFPNAENPWEEVFPETYFIQNAHDDMTLDFVAVKVGDLDCSAQTNNIDVPEERTQGTPFVLHATNDVVQQGQPFRMVLAADAIDQLEGMQFSLAFDTQKAVFEGLVNNATSLMRPNEVGVHLADEGFLTASWVNQTEQQSAPLMVLKMRALQTTTIEDIFAISSRYTKAEAYTHKDETVELILQFDTANGDPTASMRTQLFQNRPNPFKGHTTVGFYLPNAQDATLTVFDVTGKTLLQRTQQYEKGYHEQVLRKEEVGNGVLYYRLDAEGFSQTRKMIVLE